MAGKAREWRHALEVSFCPLFAEESTLTDIFFLDFVFKLYRGKWQVRYSSMTGRHHAIGLPITDW